MKNFPPRISPFSFPKSSEDQKKRSSLKFSPVFGPKLGEGPPKKSSPTVCVLKPSAQVTKRGAMPQFCIQFFANYTILSTQRGHGSMPPLNKPLFATYSIIYLTRKRGFYVFLCFFCAVFIQGRFLIKIGYFFLPLYLPTGFLICSSQKSF